MISINRRGPRPALRVRQPGFAEGVALNELAGWVAPAATMIAAMMTAANLGARLTGWGFVVFTLGSLAWVAVGASSGQTNLVASNAFLTVVNLVGVWRWLCRQRVYEEGGAAAKRRSRRPSTPSLFTATGIAGMPVVDREGAALGKAVEALVECASGQVSYLVVSTGGIGGVAEELRAVRRDAVTFACDTLRLAFAAPEFRALRPLAAGDWPGSAESTAGVPA